MAIELKEGEIFDAEVVFHVDHNELNKIIKDEIAKALVNINKQFDEYLTSHIRATAIRR